MVNREIKNAIAVVIKRIHHTPSLLMLCLEIVAGIVVSAGAFYIFWEMSEEVLEKEKFFFDHSISMFFYSLRTPWLTSLMHFLSFIGMDGIIVISVFIPVLLLIKKQKEKAIFFAVMIGLGALVNLLLKLIILRPRPDFDPLAIETSYSFPSGHSMNSFVFFITLAYFFYLFTRDKKKSLIAFAGALVLILCIGISRIYLGVHYPSDVLAGYFAGLLWFLIVLIIRKTINFLKLFKGK